MTPLATRQLRYDWWASAIRIYFGGYFDWTYCKTFMFKDQYHEDMQEAIKLFCMGEEL